MLFMSMSQIYSLIRETNRLRAMKQELVLQTQTSTLIGMKAQSDVERTQKIKALEREIRALKDMKLQVESQSKEFQRLSAENERLKNRLSGDFGSDKKTA